MNHAMENDDNNNVLLSRLSAMIADKHTDNAAIHAFITVCFSSILLFCDLLCPPIFHHTVWSVITVYSLTAVKLVC